MPMLSDKQKLMRQLQASGFALVEAQLYLDSHPTCKMGLDYFKKHKAEYEALEKEYTAKYGALCPIQADSDKKWEWVTTPFPWERGES